MGICRVYLGMKITNRAAAIGLSGIAVLVSLGGCAAQQGIESLQTRRVELPQASGADDSLDDRFGLTADAQDPHKRDEELGYGRWKAKPEASGTLAPTAPGRRRSWSESP